MAAKGNSLAATRPMPDQPDPELPEHFDRLT